MDSFTRTPDDVWAGRTYDGIRVGAKYYNNYYVEGYSFTGESTSATIREVQGSTYTDNSTFRLVGISEEEMRYQQQASSKSASSDFSSGAGESASTSFTQSLTNASQSLEDDTIRRFSYTDRTQSGGTAAVGTLVNTESGTTTGSANLATSRTFEGFGTSYGERAATLNYQTRTYTYTESLQVYATTSWTYTVAGGTASSWDTTTSEVTATFTGSEQIIDEPYAITALEDFVDTKTVTEQMTSHHNSPLEDSVYMLRANQAFDGEWNLGFMLWSLSATDSEAASSQRLGAFSDFYASTSGQTITIPDYRKFYTSSIAEGSATTDVFTFTQASLGATITRTTTRTNGYYYTHTSDTASYMDVHTHTSNLGEVGTSLHTAVTTTTPGAPVGSTTQFTHISYVSGYETTGALQFTTGTTVGTWDATSQSGRHNKWASSHAETVIVSVRMTSTDEVLASLHTVLGAGTATSRVFLGLVAHTVSYAYAQTAVSTSSVYRDPPMVGNAVGSYSESGVDTVVHHTTQLSRSSSFIESHDYSQWTYKRALPVVATTNPDFPYVPSEVRFTVPPRGYIGFGGSFTQPDPSIYLTTEQGLAAGATFHTSWTLLPPPAKDFSHAAGVTIFPTDRRNAPRLIGAGLAGSSLISIPEGLASVLSIAATWTSTVEGVAGPATSTRYATHTIGVVSAVTGEFRTAEPLVIDRADTNIGKHGPYAFTGGWGAGDNRMAAAATVRVGMGRVTWTLREPRASTGGSTGSTSGTGGSVSFTIAGGKVLLVACEPVLTLSWAHGHTGNHIAFTTPHQSHSPL